LYNAAGYRPAVTRRIQDGKGGRKSNGYCG
jgi:hypothetical protein